MCWWRASLSRSATTAASRSVTSRPIACTIPRSSGGKICQAIHRASAARRSRIPSAPTPASTRVHAVARAGRSSGWTCEANARSAFTRDVRWTARVNAGFACCSAPSRSTTQQKSDECSKKNAAACSPSSACGDWTETGYANGRTTKVEAG